MPYVQTMFNFKEFIVMIGGNLFIGETQEEANSKAESWVVSNTAYCDLSQYSKHHGLRKLYADDSGFFYSHNGLMYHLHEKGLEEPSSITCTVCQNEKQYERELSSGRYVGAIVTLPNGDNRYFLKDAAFEKYFLSMLQRFLDSGLISSFEFTNQQVTCLSDTRKALMDKELRDIFIAEFDSQVSEELFADGETADDKWIPLLNKYVTSGQNDRELIDQVTCAFTGWNLSTLLCSVVNTLKRKGAL